jgi:hypothetical protein
MAKASPVATTEIRMASAEEEAEEIRMAVAEEIRTPTEAAGMAAAVVGKQMQAPGAKLEGW